jgi:hypothetical protein
MSTRALFASLIAYCVAVGGLFSHGSFAAERLRYEPVIVRLSGKIIVEDHYGPPNFGETPKTDKKEVVPILDLDAPIAIEGRSEKNINTDSFSDIRRIQLIGSQGLDPIILAGQHVSLRGTLFEKQSGEHYTDVLMNVQEVVP